MRYATLSDALKWARSNGLNVNADSKSVKVAGAMSLRQSGLVDYLRANGFSVQKG